MLESKCKSKTGCITCRVRKVKCDEQKPACARCVTTGRKCDGYQSNFRVSSGPVMAARINNSFSVYEPKNSTFSEPQVLHLSKHFTIKPKPISRTSYETAVNYETEARATLSASLDPAIRHALVSLDALQKDFETHGDLSRIEISMAPGLRLGLQEYTHAVGLLASKLSVATTSNIRCSLLCCQLFIGIELGLNNFVSAVKHYIYGLTIMYESRNNSNLAPSPSASAQVPIKMPRIDIFVIKLFLSPCPNGLTDPFLPSKVSAMSIEGISTTELAVMQANIQLANIALSTIDLLDRISQLSSTSLTVSTLSFRMLLLTQLEEWKESFSQLQDSSECQANPQARLGTAFTALFCLVLKTAISLACFSKNELADRGVDFDKMISLAHLLSLTKQRTLQRLSTVSLRTLY